MDYSLRIDALKTGLLLCILLFCGASWYRVPFGAENFGPGGYLNLPMDQGGINLAERCQKSSNALGKCLEKHQKQWKGAAGKESVGSKSFLQEVEQMAEKKEVGAKFRLTDWRLFGYFSPSSGMQCRDEQKIVENCRWAARGTREKIQLHCSVQVLAHWKCRQAEKDGSSCDGEKSAVKQCASHIASISMKGFG